MPSHRLEVEGQEALFPTADLVAPPKRKFKVLERPLWTESKAALVARYLYYFVLITKHGTYIDPFAGRQSDRAVEGWAVEQVLKNEPGWLRKYILFEQSRPRADELEGLRLQYPDRSIVVIVGDSNVNVPRMLPIGSLGDKEASFCLLDQRTFECHWSTCRHIAQIKKGDRKVEQFYFLAQGWLDRSLAGITTPDGAAQVEAWWGQPDWEQVRTLGSMDRAKLVSDRFRNEFGYREAYPWPILERGAEGRVMYFMIHAGDHPEAPALMRRAYDWAVSPVNEPRDQLELEFQGVDWDGKE